MPTITLTFTLPEEQDEAYLAIRAGKLSSALDKIDNLLRSREKYGVWCGDWAPRLIEAERYSVEALVQQLRIAIASFSSDAEE